MFKTIFSKLIVIFISILIFSFSITGVMLFIFLTNFVSNEKVDMLNYNGAEINSYLNENIQYLNDPGTWGTFIRILRTASNNTQSIIWIVDSKGNIVLAEPELPASVKNKLKASAGHVQLPDARQYQKVMLGQDPVREIGDFYGLFKDTGESWLTIEKPFKYTNADNKQEIIAAVYLHTPIPEIHKARTSVFRLFIFSVMVSVLISTVLIYIFSLRISRPLKKINDAARVIAGGEFHKRLDIKSGDEIGELANSFNHMVTALQNLEEMRRGFIANVSHELRTPMTSIRGFIEGILDGTIPPGRQKDYLNIVRDETNRLNRLVNDLLDLARLEAGEMTLTLKDFNINELVRRCIIKLESMIVKKDLDVEADFEEDEMLVKADADAIERVVINLIHNAIKFSPEKGKINLRTFRVKNTVLVSVQDNGVGIDEDEIDLIWERFYKSDKSRSKDKSGTGLGLAIIKNIINEHRQEIWVESEIGKGTKFTFSLNEAYRNEE